MFARHTFHATPLAYSVPLDGSEAVLGLRQLQRHQDGQKLARALEPAGQASTSGRADYARYKGPYFDQLTLDDMVRPPRPWAQFFMGSPAMPWTAAYNVPEHTAMLRERAENNLAFYLANYLRIAAALGALILLLRPWALLGALSVTGLAYFNLYIMAAPEERRLPLLSRLKLSQQRLYESLLVQQNGAAAQPQPRHPLPSDAASYMHIAHTALSLATYVLVIYSNLLGACLRWLLWAVAGRPPGVPFAEALGLRSGETQDPSRVFRELWAAAYEVASAGLGYCLHACEHQWFQLSHSLGLGRLRQLAHG